MSVGPCQNIVQYNFSVAYFAYNLCQYPCNKISILFKKHAYTEHITYNMQNIFIKNINYKNKFKKICF